LYAVLATFVEYKTGGTYVTNGRLQLDTGHDLRKIKTLLIEGKYLKFEDMRALDYVEKRWEQAGHPTERWQVINFLEKMLCELKDQGE
jgi:hypothetical protein